jgi:hypothetical protein
MKKLQPMECRSLWIRCGADPYEFYLAILKLLNKERVNDTGEKS